MDGGGEADGATLVGEGPFKGWMTWLDSDAFETLAGPFYFQNQPDGRVICAMQVEEKHLNGGGAMHGGAIMTFGDFCLFALSRKERDHAFSVTVSFSGEFLGPANAGEILLCEGEVVRAGGSLVFVRGLMRVGERPVFNFSGVVKKLKKRA